MKFNLQKHIHNLYQEKTYKKDKIFLNARNKELRFEEKLSNSLKNEFENVMIAWANFYEKEQKEIIAFTLALIRSVYKSD